MNPLPGEAAEVSLDGIWVLSIFENLGQRYRTDPQLRPPIAPHPFERGSGRIAVGDFV